MAVHCTKPAPAGRLLLEGCSGVRGRRELRSPSAEKSQQAKGKPHSRDLLSLLKVPAAVRASLSVTVHIQKGRGKVLCCHLPAWGAGEKVALQGVFQDL